MRACSTAHNVSAPTPDLKETAMSLSAHMNVLETAPSPCVGDLDTSTSSTQMHTSQLLMTMDVDAPWRMPTTQGGMRTWAIATYWHWPRVHLLYQNLLPPLV